MDLTQAEARREYIIKEIKTDDDELNSFLFTLGCYSGEPITVLNHVIGGCFDGPCAANTGVAVDKDGRVLIGQRYHGVVDDREREILACGDVAGAVFLRRAHIQQDRAGRLAALDNAVVDWGIQQRHGYPSLQEL